VRLNPRTDKSAAAIRSFFLISSLAMESNPLGMVKSSASGLLFFCDCGH